MEQLYELVVEGDERLVATEEPVEVGDVLIVGDEVLLVLRESDAVAPGRRYECRRALQLRNRAQNSSPIRESSSSSSPRLARCGAR